MALLAIAPMGVGLAGWLLATLFIRVTQAEEDGVRRSLLVGLSTAAAGLLLLLLGGGLNTTGEINVFGGAALLSFGAGMATAAALPDLGHVMSALLAAFAGLVPAFVIFLWVLSGFF